MSKHSDLQLIDKAFYALERALEFTDDWRQYYAQNVAEERGHRRMKWVNVPDGITRNQAAKLFCVRQIAEYMNGDPAPDVANIFSCRLSIYQAYSLVVRYRERIEAALQAIDLQTLLALDYAELNKAA